MVLPSYLTKQNIQPDGVQRQIVGEIIKRFEQKGYKLVALKLVHPSEDFAKEHYSDLSTKPFFPGLVKYFSSGPVVAMVWEGRNVIKGGRKLVGATNPDQSEPGSIRGDLAVDVGRYNLLSLSLSATFLSKESSYVEHYAQEYHPRIGFGGKCQSRNQPLVSSRAGFQLPALHPQLGL